MMGLLRFLCPTHRPPTWLSFLFGLILGCILTSTFTFRLRWCSHDNQVVAREPLQIVKANEHLQPLKQLKSLSMQEEFHSSSQNEDCVCGNELRTLREKANHPPHTPRVRHHSNSVPSPNKISFKPLRTLRDIDLSSFTHPSSTSSATNQSSGQPLYLSKVIGVRLKLLVAVVTCESHLTNANSVYDTWGFEVSQLLFFVGDKCNTSLPDAKGLPLVRLPGVPDSPCNSVTKTFSILKYLAENFLSDYHWFMLAVDEMYLRVEELEKVLAKLNSSEPVYLGRAANGKDSDVERLSLLPHEHYCLGGTGIVISNRLLRDLEPHLDYCSSAAVMGERGMVHPDVELGRCISRRVGVQCTHSQESKSYFLKQYSDEQITPKALSKRHFSDLLTFHPVPDLKTMLTLHYHYKKLQLENTKERSEVIMDELNDLCTQHNSEIKCDLIKCDCSSSTGLSKLPPSPTNVNSPPSPYRASTIYDYQSWEFFDDKTIYNDMMVQPSFWLHSRKNARRELQIMLSKVVKSASERFGRQLKFKKVIDGWVRHNPSRGSEYIVDCLFMDGFKRSILRRVNLLRPLAPNYLTLRDNDNVDTTISFIVPIARVNERLAEFMSMYEDLALKTNEKVKLLFSVYGSEDIEFVTKIVTPYLETYPSASITVLEGKGTFSRGRALHLGMSKLSSGELAFLCDVDMTVTKPFLDRCRRNAIPGQRVYFPEFFKLYNLDYVYHKKPRPRSISMKRMHGHWAYYSYGMVCVYKADYDRVGGMNTNIIGWGDEDVNFFEKVIRKKIDVLRSPDTGLSHRWHEKVCSKELSPKQFKHCISSRGENLADRIELANFIYDRGVQISYSAVSSQQDSPRLSIYSNETSDSDSDFSL